MSLPAALLRPAEKHFLATFTGGGEKMLRTFKYFYSCTFLKGFRCTLMYLINSTFKTMTFSIKREMNAVSRFYPRGVKLHLFLCNRNHGWVILMWNLRVRQCSRYIKGTRLIKPIHGPQCDFVNPNAKCTYMGPEIKFPTQSASVVELVVILSGDSRLLLLSLEPKDRRCHFSALPVPTQKRF